MCISCNKEQGYYRKIDDRIYEHSFIDCYKNPEGYYLSNELIYEKCYSSCKFCISDGNENDNKCLECLEHYTFKNDFPDKKNCYPECQYNYYYDKEDNNKYKCTITDKCPSNYIKFIEGKKRCIDECINDNIYKYEYDNKCYKQCPKGTFASYNNNNLCINVTEPEKHIDNSIFKENKLNITGSNISMELLNSLSKEYYNQIGDTPNVVKSSNNDLNIYIYKDINTLEKLAEEAPLIDFGECYKKVKEYYGINDDLIVTIINNETNKDIYGKSTNKYVFSFPDSGKTIDTTNICDENDKIIIKEDLKHLVKGLDDQKEEYINFLTKQGINIFNISDKFYNDLCFYYESPNNKDVPLKDRISTFFPNLSLCDPGCENKGVDLVKMKAKCECIFINILSNELMDNLSGGFLSEIMSILSSVNIEVLKCFKNLFDKKSFSRAVGGYFILCLFFMKMICIIIFLTSKLYSIKKHIFSLSDSFLVYKGKNMNAPPKRKKYNNRSKTAIIKSNNELKDTSNSNYQNSRKFLGNSSIKKDKEINNLIINKFELCEKNKNIFEKKESCNLVINMNNDPEKDKYLKQIKSYLDESFDENDFLDVLDKETRTFCQYFMGKYKNNQIVVNTFCVQERFKPRTIKIIIFIITIELYLVVNALFYNEEYLSELFNSNKEEYLFSFVPRRISHFVYSSVVNIIISFVIGFFYIEEDKVKRTFIRFYNDTLTLQHELVLTLKEIDNRFKLFVIFSIIISLFSFVYISCFNMVYPYIRIEWIVSSIFIFIVMQFVNLFIVFFECCIRFLAIRCNSEKLFKLSLLLD